MTNEYKSSLKIFNKHDCFFKLKFDIAYKHRCHACTYCYRKGFMEMSGEKDIDNIQTEDFTYADPEVLRKALENADKGKGKGEVNKCLRAKIPIRLGSMIDPLVYFDSKIIDLTFRTLQILNEYNYPYLLFTKSNVVASSKFIKEISESKKRALIHLCLAFNDDKTRQIMEPNAPSVIDRKRAMLKMIPKQIPFVLRMAPIAPYLNVDQCLELIDWFADKGGKKVLFEELRCSPKYKEWLKQKFGSQVSDRFKEWNRGYWKLDINDTIDMYGQLTNAAVEMGLKKYICGNYPLHQSLCYPKRNCCGFDNPKAVFPR
jgi:DNA repair photolyase